MKMMLKPWSLGIHKMQVSRYRHLSVKQSIYRQDKWIPVAPDDISKSYEVKQLVCARNQTFFTALLPVIQILMQTVQSVVWVVSETFFWTGYFTELMNQFTKSD